MSAAALESRVASYLMAATLSDTDKAELRDSRYPSARIAEQYLAAFAANGEASDLSCATDAILTLAKAAGERDTEAREANARAEGLAAQLSAEQDSRDKADQATLALQTAFADMADILTLSRDDFGRLAGSPFTPGRALVSALNGLAVSLGERDHSAARLECARLAAAIVDADAEGVRVMGSARAADESAHAANANSAAYREQRDAEGARAVRAEGALAALMAELGGARLHTLPGNVLRAYDSARVAMEAGKA